MRDLKIRRPEPKRSSPVSLKNMTCIGGRKLTARIIYSRSVACKPQTGFAEWITRSETHPNLEVVGSHPAKKQEAEDQRQIFRDTQPTQRQVTNLQ